MMGVIKINYFLKMTNVSENICEKLNIVIELN